MPDSNLFTRSDALGYYLDAASRLIPNSMTSGCLKRGSRQI